MQQVNPFHFLHQTLKALLNETGRFLQQTEFSAGKKAVEAAVRLQALVEAVEKYCQAESQHLMPVLSLFEPGVADSVGQDQNEIRQCGKELLHLLPLAEKRPAGQQLAMLFENYRLYCIRYVQREETAVCPLLLRYCTRAELHQLALAILHCSGLASRPLLAADKQEDPPASNANSARPGRPQGLLQQTLAVGAMAVEG